MAKMSKELQWRIEGMLAAHKIVSEKGLEELTKEIKMRQILKIDLWAKKGDVEAANESIANNVYHCMMSTIFFVLHDTFGFGGKRLKRLKSKYDKVLGDIYNLDYMGEHYTRYEDYSVYLNQKYDMGFDTDRIAALQTIHDGKDSRYKRCDVGQVIEELRNNGFEDAAVWLEKKIA